MKTESTTQAGEQTQHTPGPWIYSKGTNARAILGVEPEPYDDEQKQGDACSSRGISPRDPSYDPEHDWRLLGDYDGICFYRCRKCGNERES